MLIPFRCYTDESEDGAELVWAHEATEAIALARTGNLFSGLEDDAEVFAAIETAITGTEPEPGLGPHIENRDRVLREYGWRCEGDDVCEGCGLSTWDGDFPLCADCDLCDDCGHAADCRRGLLLGEQAEVFGEVFGRLIYVAAPYRGVDEAQVHRHLARVGLLNRLLIRLYAHPVALHAAIHAGHYGRDDVAAERGAGLECASAIASRIRRAGGGVIALEREGGGVSDGTAHELYAANNGRTWVPNGRKPEAGIAVLRWRNLGPVFEVEGLGREWAALCATSAVSTGGELFPLDSGEPPLLFEAPPCAGFTSPRAADDIPRWPAPLAVVRSVFEGSQADDDDLPPEAGT